MQARVPDLDLPYTCVTLGKSFHLDSPLSLQCRKGPRCLACQVVGTHEIVLLKHFKTIKYYIDISYS